MFLLNEIPEQEVKELLSQKGKSNLQNYTSLENSSDSNPCSEDSDTSDTPRTQLRLAKTVAILWAFFGLGLDFGCYGPAVVNLEAIMDTNFKPLAVAMTTGSVGVFFGSLAGGALIDILNEELFLGASCIYLGVTTAMLPWSPNVYVFGVLYGLNDFAVGVIDAAGQPYPLRLWNRTPYRDPVYQAIHATWSIAATLGPLLMMPFLTSIPSDGISTNSLSYVNETLKMNESINASNITSSSEHPHVERVRYGFALVGLVNVMVGILFFIIFAIQGPSCLLKNAQPDLEEPGKKTKDARYKNILLVMLLFFFVVYTLVEYNPGTFFSAMAVKGLGWDVTLAAGLAAVYWGFHCTGSILAIPLSGAFSPNQMMIPSLVLTALAFVLLSLFNERNIIVWLGAGMSGFGVSWMFGSCILWASDYIDMSGMSSGISLAGLSIGELITSPLIGHLSESYSYLWIVYLCLIGSVTVIVSFVGMQLFVAIFAHKYNQKEDDEDSILVKNSLTPTNKPAQINK